MSSTSSYLYSLSTTSLDIKKNGLTRINLDFFLLSCSGLQTGGFSGAASYGYDAGAGGFAGR